MIRRLTSLSILMVAMGGSHPAAAVSEMGGKAGASAVTVNSNDPRVFPNPWRSDRNPNVSVTFDRLPPNATVRLFTISGQEVKNLEAASGSVSWDRTNESGEKVASGIYLYLVSDILGTEYRGKLAIIN